MKELKGEFIIMKKVELKGIITPILTPMKEDESINTEELRNQIERLIAGGVHGIFPFGTNGEGYILSETEKVEVLETTIDQVKGRVPVYAGSGCISTADTIRMSKKAEELGADVLSIITPSFAVASQKELYDHYVEVAKHVDTPIVLYNIPARTGNKLLPETVAKLAKDVDIIVGAKDSSGDWENLKAYIHQTQDLEKDFYVLSGNDSLILPSLKEGGFGGIAGCSNVYPHVLSSIYDLFKEGKMEEAEAAQESIASFRAVFKYGNPNTVVKKAVKMLGYPVGDCRRPFNYLCDEGVEALAKVLEEKGAVVEEFDLSLVKYAIPAYYVIAAAEASSNLSRFDGVKYGYRAKDYEGLHNMYKKTRSEGFGAEVKRRIMLGSFVLSSGYYDAYYLKALRTKALIKKEFDKAFEKYDVILGPVAPTTAPKLGDSLSDPIKMYLGDIYTISVNLAGLPGISLPCGKDKNGMPIGLQLIGDCFNEKKIIQAAYTFEQTRAYEAPAIAKGGAK